MSGGSWTAEEFYRQRDGRSQVVLGGPVQGDRPLHITVDAEACAAPAGQALTLGLVNQLARVHRRVMLRCAEPHAPLLSPALVAAPTIEAALLCTMQRIDPFGVFETCDPWPDALTLGVGAGAPKGLTWYIGAAGACASLARDPQALLVDHPGTLGGAALASCLAAAALCREAHGLPAVPRRLSAWNFAEGMEAAAAHEELVPIEVGRILMVGAGAVGSALAYWLKVLGARSTWTVIDKDEVELHNTNRALLFFPDHAGWGGAKVAAKAELVCAALPASRSEIAWYHAAAAAKERADVILALANECDVRTAIASRSGSLVLHATTGTNWVSQLHRHIAGRDDCIACRTADLRMPTMGCSTGIIPGPIGSKPSDAALPFLSAASGLMLAMALQRLQHGQLAETRENDWTWLWDSAHRMTQSNVRACRTDCRQVQPLPIRRVMNAGNRWHGLEG